MYLERRADVTPLNCMTNNGLQQKTNLRRDYFRFPQELSDAKLKFVFGKIVTQA
jgi:hypothetical protein